MFCYILRVLLPVSLLGAFPATASAQLALEATTTVLPVPMKLVGEVSIKELAARPAMARPPQRPIEMLKHRRPDGSVTSQPLSKATVEKLPSLSSNVSVSSQSGPGFIGIHSADNANLTAGELEPPDQGLAVYNNVAAVINNDALRFFRATDGTALAYNASSNPIDVYSFFFANPFNLVTDPQVFFDPTTGRWFFTALETDTLFTEQLDLAVSKTSDPLGAYYVFHGRLASSDLSGCSLGFGLDCLPDFPHAGYDANGFYISVNLFNVLSGKFVAAATWPLPKSKLESGQSFTPVRIKYPNDFVVEPSVPACDNSGCEPYETAANGTEYLLEARNIQDGSNKIRIWAISNTNNIVTNPASLRAKYADVTAEAYGPAVNATEPNVIGPYCTSQQVTSAPQLDGVYQSFTATVQKANNGKLYGALNFGATDGSGLARDILAWFAIRPSVNASAGVPSATIAYQGYVIPPNGYSLLNPAFGLNKSGKGYLGFSITSPDQTAPGGFPSAGLIQFTGSGTTGNITVTGQGVTSDDGFSGCGQNGELKGKPAGVGRWGDYGAATVDAATGLAYTANENISGQRGTYTNWGTFITRLTPPQ